MAELREMLATATALSVDKFRERRDAEWTEAQRQYTATQTGAAAGDTDAPPATVRNALGRAGVQIYTPAAATAPTTEQEDAEPGPDASDHGTTSDTSDDATTSSTGATSSGSASDSLMPLVLPDDFFETRPVLAHIREAARARRVAPTALLGVVLARAAAFTPPSTCVPPFVGGHVPLSLFVALIAATGDSKSTTMAAARALLPLSVPGVVGPRFLGSGEGLADA